MEQESGKQTDISRRSPAEHLRPHWFQPGQSGNPSGRPKGIITFANELRKALQEQPNGDGKTRMRRILDAAIDRAEAGDLGYFRELVDRIDGKQIAAALGAADVGSISVDQMLITIQRVRAELPEDSEC